MADSIGSVCVKDQVKGTEYECACQECEKSNLFLDKNKL
jgi:hypothetical protein